MFAKVSKAALLIGLLVASPTMVVAQDEQTSLESRPDCEFVAERQRRRPGGPPPDENICEGEGLQPAVWRPLPEFAAIPDRWRIVSALGYPERLWDPYNGNNVLKGDRPAFGEDWFFSLGLISDSTFEGRSVPTPVATATPPG